MQEHSVLLLLVLVAAGCRESTAPTQPVAAAFSSATDATWTGIASMSDARFAHAAAAGTDGRIYVFAGFRSSGLSTAEVFDPGVNSWSSIAPPGIQILSGAARGRDGRMYLVGGADAGLRPMARVQAYDPASDAWTLVGSLGAARHTLAVAAGADGRVYAFGGNAGSSVLLASGEVYDQGTDTWSAIAPMSIARQGHAAATGRDGRIFILGGLTPDGPTAACEAYDPGRNSWSPIADLPRAQFGHAAATGADGLIYVFGGMVNGERSNGVFAYDPAGNAWSSVASMNLGRYLPAAAAAPNGLLYVTGGQTPQGISATAETFQTIPSNRAPVANAGDDFSAECLGGGADVALDGSKSSDPDGDQLTYEWFEKGSPIASGQQASVHLGQGAHAITLRVTDGDGAADEDDVMVTVEDTEAPEITLVQHARFLWPPNHQMRLVADISAQDACDGAPSLEVKVSSNEPINGSGDGNTAPDWQVFRTANGIQVWVRSERAGADEPRVYAIVATATDHAGNSASQSATVTVTGSKTATARALPSGKIKF